MLPEIEKLFLFGYNRLHLFRNSGNQARNEDNTRKRSWKTGGGGISKSISPDFPEPGVKS